MYQFTDDERRDYYTLHKLKSYLPYTILGNEILQETPLVDEQGNYYAYKILIFCPRGFVMTTYLIGHFKTNGAAFISPVYPRPWENFFMYEKNKISENNTFGIYSLKSIFQKEMDGYAFQGHFDPEMVDGSTRVLVKLLLSGDIIEGRYGFRSSEATIVGVSRLKDERYMWYTPQEVVEQVGKRVPEYRGVSYGYWKDDQDYSGSTAPYPGRYP